MIWVCSDAEMIYSNIDIYTSVVCSKDSFFQPLSFDSQGYLQTAFLELTQLAVLNLTSRRLQPGQPPADIAPPIQSEPISREELLNFARLQPVLRGVYTLSPGTGEALVGITKVLVMLLL